MERIDRERCERLRNVLTERKRRLWNDICCVLCQERREGPGPLPGLSL